jgi:DNA-binding transcriptional MerR regulator
MELSFTSAEVMARTGITARQLQWWDERGIVVPAREGHRRLYSIDDLAEVAVICDLRRRGFSLQRVRKVIRLLQKEFKKRLVDTVSAHAEYHLLTDGTRIFLKNSAEQVIDILKNSQQPMLTICLSDTVRQIQADLVPGRRKAAAGAIVRVKRAAV